MRLRKIVIILFVLAVFLSGSSRLTFATGEVEKSLPEASEIWKKILEVNPALKDYSVSLKIKVEGKYHFISPQLDLTGTYYFKKPDKHKLELDRVSYFLNKYPRIFGWNLPALERFNATVKMDKIDERSFYVVSLTPKKIITDLIGEEIWVDIENYTYPRHTYLYKKEGSITVNVTYRKEKNFILYDRMVANFNFPRENLTAKADASYGTYKINQGISDDFFEKK